MRAAHHHGRFPRLAVLLLVGGITLCGSSSFGQDARPARPADTPAAEKAEGAVPGGWYFEGYGYYLVGDYGTGETTETFYFPLTLGAWYGRFRASATVPFIYQENEGGVTTIGGTPIPTGDGEEGGAAIGLGDILLEAGVFALQETDDLPYVLFQVEGKMPTANDNEGLGTGEFDLTLRGTVGKKISERVKAYGQLGYAFIGEPEDALFDFQDTFHWGLGAAYVPGPRHELWLHAKGNTPVVDGTDPAAALFLQYVHTFPDGKQFYAIAGPGLTDASPDLVIGLGFRVPF